jgi:hypothetical protein
LSERPPQRWCHADVRLEDFAIVTWAADVDRLKALLPRGFEPELRGDSALVSLVGFRDRGFHFRAAPFARLSCGQVNYRAYVRRGDDRGVWFFGTALDSRLVSIPRTLWSMPWHRTSVRIDADWAGGTCDRWSLASAGAWGRASVELTGTPHRFRLLAGFADHGDMSDLLIDPFVGWYGRRNGGIGRYSVWHEPLQLCEASPRRAECGVFEDLGLIEPGQRPVSAGLQAHVRFDVHTPPTRVAPA